MTGAEMIAEERLRQQKKEGWTPEHDDQHTCGELVQAAGCYADHARSRAWVRGGYPDGDERYRNEELPIDWPDEWHENWWKPKDPIRDLVRAGALIAAEIDRLKRLAG